MNIRISGTRRAGVFGQSTVRLTRNCVTPNPIARGLILALAVGLAGFTNSASATILNVAIDTASLTGTQGQLAFDLTDGDNTLNNNTVTITNFVTDGTLGFPVIAGGVSGALPGDVSISDTNFFNELLQPLTFATSISFTLTLTDNYDADGSFPDQFALYLVDFDTSIPQPLFTTSDPMNNGALFAVDLGVNDGLSPYQPTSSPAASWSVTHAPTVPEPGALILFGTGLLALVGCRRRRQAPQSPADRAVSQPSFT